MLILLGTRLNNSIYFNPFSIGSISLSIFVDRGAEVLPYLHKSWRDKAKGNVKNVMVCKTHIKNLLLVRANDERARTRIAEQLPRHAVVHRALALSQFVSEADRDKVAY